MAKEEKAETAAKEPKRGVGTVAVEAIKAGKDNAEALKAVQAEFPEAKTSLASINWYRNKLRSEKAKGDDGKLVPTARELSKKKTAEAADPLA